MKEASGIRPGEELDEGRLAEFLRMETGGPVERLEIRQFPAGSSNLTYLVVFDGQRYVLRRPPFGNRVPSAHDMKREFQVLSALQGAFAPAPKPFVYCGDEGVIGSEFYLMEERNGLIIRGKAPSEVESSEELSTDVCRAFIRNLAELHSFDHKSAGLEDFGRPDGYAERQIVGWSKRYFNAKTDQWDELEEAIFWLNNRIPGDDGAVLIHNDYKFDNVILDPADPTRVTGVLDWEMATVGSPLMDLGTTLGYWMSPSAGTALMETPFNPKVLMERISRRELAEMYAEYAQRDVSAINFYYVFGTVKIAVIAQQIYFRYKKGYTADERFAAFGSVVSSLGKIALAAIQKGNI